MRGLFNISGARYTGEPQELAEIIRGVRNRWRVRVLLRGLVVLLAAGLLIFALSSFGMDRFRFAVPAVWMFRILTYGGMAYLAFRFLVKPFLSPVSDERVALYLEEHTPGLESSVVSAVEFASPHGRSRPVQVSPALAARLVERAVEECRGVEYGRKIESGSLLRSSSVLAGVTATALVMFFASPGFMKTGAPFLLKPLGAAGAVNPYSVTVEPGDVTVARGADQRIIAHLVGFQSDRVEIAVRLSGTDVWDRIPMVLDDESGAFLHMFFDLDRDLEYYVGADGVRSPSFKVSVQELPYVDRIDLIYDFPAYTGLESERLENTGDMAAVKGTHARIVVLPTMKVGSAAILVNNADTIPMEVLPDGSLDGTIVLTKPGFYRVLLEAPDGELVVGSPDYMIDVLEDQPPSVTISKPGRDIKVGSLEEVYVEARAQDDYGIRKLELAYSVNGGEQKTVTLYGGNSSRRQRSAGYTFYLEEFELEPGDFISYFARATDGNRVKHPATATTDIYFMEVRPPDRKYRQSDQQGGNGSANGPMPSALSYQQRQIIAATFNIIHKDDPKASDDRSENLATVALGQGRLREDVATLIRRLETRGVNQMDSTFAVIARELKSAVAEMEKAEEALIERDAQRALAAEQRALQPLQRAEAAFRETTVQRQQGGGSPGSRGQISEDLSDLFELETDKLKNQYEQVQRGERQKLDEQVDEALQKLQELARRQQQANERRRAGGENSGARGGGGSPRTQRRMADEAEELARRLEKLARERSDRNLEQTARELTRAANEMRRASGNSSRGLARGLSALERLKEARRLLDRNKRERLEQQARDARSRAGELAQLEQRVQEDVKRLKGAGAQRREDLIERIDERKIEMVSRAAELERDLDRLAADAREEQPDASGKLKDAATSIRDNQLKEAIAYTRAVVRARSAEVAERYEEQIGSGIQELENRLDDALQSFGETRGDRMARALEKTRDAVRGLESLKERTGQAGQENRAREGSTGQAGEGGGVQTGRAGEGRGLRRQQVRRFQREFRERRQDLRALRNQLQQSGGDVSDLNQAIAALGRFDNNGPFRDPRGLAELQESIIQGLKEFEFALRRQLEGASSGKLFLSGNQDVPEGYRQMVEDYYKALSESGKNDGR